MSHRGRTLLTLAALAGFSGVALAAVGSHALDISAGPDRLAWQSAMLVHLIHAAALLALTALAERSVNGWIMMSGLLMALGVALFSGSIVLRLATGIHLPMTAPAGGICLMLAWLALLLAAWRSPSTGAS